MKPLIIFDFDGTIADTFPVILDIFHKVERRTKPLTNEEAMLMRGAALLQVKMHAVIRAAARLNVPIWRLPFVFAISRLILKKRMGEVQPFPGMAESIKELSGDKYQLFIVSANSTRNIKKFLRKHGLNSCFTKVYGDVRPHNKAKVIQAILKQHKSGGKAWLVGDENRDIAAGHAAGIKTVAVTWGYNTIFQLEDSKPNHTVSTTKKLLKVLR